MTQMIYTKNSVAHHLCDKNTVHNNFTFFLTILFTILCYIRPFEVFPALREFRILLIVGALAGSSLLIDVISGRVKLFIAPTDQMMLGLSFAICLSHLYTGWVGGVINSISDFFPTFIEYFLVAHSIRNDKQFRIFILCVISCTCFIAFESIIQIYYGSSLMGVLPLIQNVRDQFGQLDHIILRTKWLGTFSDPNDLAIAFVICVPFLLSSVLKKRSLLSFAALVLLVYSIYLTQSRGGFLALLFCIMVYLSLHYNNIKALLAFLLISVTLLSIAPDRIAEISSNEDSAHQRVEAWYEGYQMFKNSPIFGVGHREFVEHHHITAHNSYILVMAELGFIGSYFFVGLFYYPIVASLRILSPRRRPAYSDTLSTSMAVLSASLAGLALSMFFLSRSYTLLPYMLIGLSIASVRNSILFEDINNFFRPKAALIKIFFINIAIILLINIFLKFVL